MTKQKGDNTMKMALQIKTDGTLTELDLSQNSLETLQQAVEGLVQAVDIAGDLTMWCNEEGKMISLPHNPYGQAFWETAFPVSEFGRTDYIVGDIVLTGGTDAEGETLGLSVAQVFQIKDLARAIKKMVEPQIVVF